jgi:hypothetical protein
MNQSFCRFIKSTEHMDEIGELEKEAGQSAWQASKLVLVAGAIGTFVWLLYAQADLFRIGLGYVAGIGALLTAAVNFFAGGKRTAQSASVPVPPASPSGALQLGCVCPQFVYQSRLDTRTSTHAALHGEEGIGIDGGGRSFRFARIPNKYMITK